MNFAKKLLALLALLPGLAFANEGGVALDQAPDRSNNMAALQHGAKLFVNYCLNCHNASSMRYNRLKDLALASFGFMAVVIISPTFSQVNSKLVLI